MIVIGSDHSGIELKKRIINYLIQKHIECEDVSNYENQDGDDYPDIALVVCKKVSESHNNIGISICGNGVGMTIACNKVNGIRAALCTDTYMAEMARKDNDANILCLGARWKMSEKIEDITNIIDVFLNTFYDGGRHDRRLEKIRVIEQMNSKGEI